MLKFVLVLILATPWLGCNMAEPIEKLTELLEERMPTREELNKLIEKIPTEKVYQDFILAFEELAANLKKILAHFGK